MNVLEPYIQEQTSLESLARSYFENRKDVPYVRTKLREKLFESEDIESMLSNLASEYEDFERYEMVLNHKIEDGMAKGKSMRKVEMELTAAYPSFKSQVIELVKRVYVDEVEVLKSCHEKSLHTYHQADRKTKHKIVASLYSKGFSMESIKRFLSAQDDEESE